MTTLRASSGLALVNARYCVIASIVFPARASSTTSEGTAAFRGTNGTPSFSDRIVSYASIASNRWASRSNAG